MGSFSYGEENLEYNNYEGEHDYEEDTNDTLQFDEITVQDFSRANYMFNKAGCGLTSTEVNLIEITINQMISLGKIKNIR